MAKNMRNASTINAIIYENTEKLKAILWLWTSCIKLCLPESADTKNSHALRYT